MNKKLLLLLLVSAGTGLSLVADSEFGEMTTTEITTTADGVVTVEITNEGDTTDQLLGAFFDEMEAFGPQALLKIQTLLATSTPDDREKCLKKVSETYQNHLAKLFELMIPVVREEATDEEKAALIIHASTFNNELLTHMVFFAKQMPDDKAKECALSLKDLFKASVARFATDEDNRALVQKLVAEKKAESEALSE